MIQILRCYRIKSCPIPLYECPVSAGFPSPADDYIDGSLDLNDHLIQHPAATFFVRAHGNSMTGAGIHDGDLLIVDKAKAPLDGKVVIAAIDGELVVKRLTRKGSRVYLEAENDDYPPIELREGQELKIWGVVIHVIHSV